MSMAMNLRFLIFCSSFILPAMVFGQQDSKNDFSIPKSWFSGTLSFLSSGWMEGREAGERGAFMASDYIASLMESNDLEPFGDALPPGSASNRHNRVSGEKRSYFQNFDLVRFKISRDVFTLTTNASGSRYVHRFTPGLDYRVEPSARSFTAEAPVVFAGYGIHAPELGYDDFRNLDVRGAVVVVMKGFPGHRDTTSLAWRRFGKTHGQEYSQGDTKLKTAIRKGAIALVIVTPDATMIYDGPRGGQHSLEPLAMNAAELTEPEYKDEFSHELADRALISGIPCYWLAGAATELLFRGSGISLTETEIQVAKMMETPSTLLSQRIIGIEMDIITETVPVRNVVAILPGTDTTRNIIIGAHYDHLGIRGGRIYLGADDNASGAAGVLAMARFWKERGAKPPVNLIFAAWTAEEKGLLGSCFFAEQRKVSPLNTLLMINFDMISRSAPEDTARRVLSIGTLADGVQLRKLAIELNRELARPFELDLWECSKHGGSDYASFAAENVQVMTFFSGFHNDYHTSRDIAGKTDLEKMGNVLNLSNSILFSICGGYNISIK